MLSSTEVSAVADGITPSVQISFTGDICPLPSPQRERRLPGFVILSHGKKAISGMRVLARGSSVKEAQSCFIAQKTLGTGNTCIRSRRGNGMERPSVILFQAERCGNALTSSLLVK